MTQTEARRAALLDAIEQVNGLRMEASSSTTSLSKEQVKRINEHLSSTAKIEAGTWQDLHTFVHGVISRYRVRYEGEDKQTHRWRSELEVVCPSYRSDTPELQRAIAIIPFRSEQETYPILGGSLRGPELIRRLTQKLVSEMTQPRRLRVLNRDYAPEVNDELKRIESGSLRSQEVAKLGRRIGADLLLVGNVNTFQISTRPIEAAGSLWHLQDARLTSHFEVIDVATAQTRWSDDVNRTYDDNALRRLGLKGDPEATLEGLLTDVAHAISTEIFEIISPVKILNIPSRDLITLNQGGTRTKLGQCLTILGPTQYSSDPENSSAIRVDGEPLGFAQIEQVNAKYSIARILEGDSTKLSPGLTCRFGNCPSPPLTTPAAIEPPLEISSFRLFNGWQFQIKNTGGKPIMVKEIKRGINGSSESAAFRLTIAPGETEPFGLDAPFEAGDTVQIFCDGYEAPRTYRIH